MGGVAAIVRWDAGPCAAREVEGLLHASRFRAADGTSSWAGDGAALGYQRFITISEQARDQQPLVNDDRATAFVFDGRLDNRPELGAAIGRNLASLPDAAIAFEAFLRWGPEAAARLLGDFTFIAWEWHERRLTAARDHMGVRLLHFAARPGLLVCATDIAQVLAHPQVPREPDTSVAADHLAGDIRNDPGTLFRGVSRLPPGHVLVATAESTRTHAYWTAEPKSPIRYGRDEDYAAHCRELLVSSVDARLRGDRRLAALLSGGLDSSSVVTVAHVLVTGRDRPQPFSMVFPGRRDADEREFIEAVAERCGATPVLVVPAAIDAAALRARARASAGIPPMPADEMAAALYRAIAAAGHRAVLTGAGGDFLFSGSVFQYADLLRAGRPLKAIRRFMDDRRPHDTGWSPLGLLQAGVWPALPLPVKRALRPIARRVARTGDPAWLRLPREPQPYPQHPRAGSYATEDVTRLVGSGMHFFFLECGERTAAQAGLELRHPFLDARLVQFALDIPDDQRRRGQYTKYVLRRALAGELPGLVGRRTTKAAAGHAVVETLVALGGERFFQDLAIGEAGWVDADALARSFTAMRRAYEAGEDAYGRHVPSLWMVAAIELWFRDAFVVRG